MPLRRLERKNMQLKKIALVFLVVIMMFSLAAVCTAAEGAGSEISLSAKLESEGAISADPFAVKPGDIIELIVSVDSNPGSLRSLEIRVEFDNDALEFQGIATDDYGVIFEKNDTATRTNVTSKDDANTIGTVQVWLMANTGYESDKTGEFITLRFKVYETFDGDIEKLGITYANSLFTTGIKSVALPTLPEVKAHNYGEPADEEGNCVSSANKVYTCTHEGCDEVLKVPTGELGGHKCETLNGAVAPTCSATGNVAYYVCANEGCGKYIAEDKTTVLESVVVAIDPDAHKCETLNGAVAPTCTAAGQKAHYVCGNAGCGKFIAEDKTTVLDSVVLAIDPNAHKCETLNGAVAPTCAAAGQKAHYVCGNAGCGKYIAEDKTTVLSSVVVAIDPDAHKCETLNAAVPSDCVTNGTVAYYVCGNTGCGKNIAEDKKTVLETTVAPLAPHKCEQLIGAVNPDCETNGNVAYYICATEGCGKYIAEDKTTVLDTIVVDKLGHNYGDLIAKVEPTTEKAGNVAHYQCSVCSKYFDSSADKKEIESPIIPKLPVMISTPENTVWTKGDETSLKFVSDAKYVDFVGVKLNGALLAEGTYKLEADADGNTVVTLEPAYLETLEKGEYNIAIESTNGTCDANFTVENNGAIVAIIIVVVAVVVIVAGAAAAVVVLKKKNIL